MMGEDKHKDACDKEVALGQGESQDKVSCGFRGNINCVWIRAQTVADTPKLSLTTAIAESDHLVSPLDKLLNSPQSSLTTVSQIHPLS